MLILYAPDTKDFNNMGLGVLPNALNVTIVEEINGQYSLDIEYMNDANKTYEIIQNRCIIKVTDYNNQLFRIQTLNFIVDRINIRAEHISYDLLNNLTNPYVVLNKYQTLSNFLSNLSRNLYLSTQFKFVSEVSGNYTGDVVNYQYSNPLDIFLNFATQGDQNLSIVNLFGCQMVRDNFTITFRKIAGKDNGVQLRFRKNITSFDLMEDYSNVVTKVFAQSNDGIILPTVFMNSPNINNYDMPLTKAFVFTDITRQEIPNPDAKKLALEPNPTPPPDNITVEVPDPDATMPEPISNVQARLIFRVNQLFNIDKIDEPERSIKVSFKDLSQTTEYKNNAEYNELENVKVGDIVTVIIDYLNIQFTAQIVRVSKNILVPPDSDFEIRSTRPNLWDELIGINVKIVNINKL